MKRALVLCVLAACGKVSGSDEDAMTAVPDAAAVADAQPPVDSPPDAFTGCLADELNAAALGPDWEDHAVGAAPTITFGSGFLAITDAATAPTGADGKGDSWIYDLDTDKGNQMRWKAPVGTRDFTLTSRFGWATTGPELTFAGLALVNAEDQIETLIGFEDPSASPTPGAPAARIRVAGPPADKVWAGPRSDTGSDVEMSIRRTGEQLVIRNGDELVLEEKSFKADIRGLVIFSVKHVNASKTEFPFGTVRFDRVSLCF